MGLTFEQRFAYIPEDVYFVQFLEPGDMESARSVFAIIEKPEDEQEALELESCFNAAGYILESYSFDELVHKGRILKKEIDKEC